MYPTAGIGLFWAGDCFWVARRILLPWHISVTSWMLAIPCNVHSSASVSNSKSFTVSRLSKAV
jgi:hypothetical protein